jgi:hypothetical protein
MLDIFIPRIIKGIETMKPDMGPAMLGKGCRDTIFSAHEVMTHFVGKKNRHDGGAVDGSLHEVCGKDCKDEQ